MLFLLLLLNTANAGCENPKSAASTLFDGIAAGDLQLAKSCLQLSKADNGERLAVQLKTVLDARGKWVPVAGLPTDPNYVDESGRPHLVVMPEDFPGLVLVKDDEDRWLYSKDTMTAVPVWYAETFSPLSNWFQSNLPPIFYNRILGLYGWQWLYGLLLGVAAFVFGRLITVFLRAWAGRVLGRFGLSLDQPAAVRAAAPLGLAASFAMLWYVLPDVQLPVTVSHPGLWALSVGAWVFGVVAAYRFVDVGEGLAKSWAQRTESKMDDQAIPLLRQFVRALLLVFGVLYIADAMGFDVWKLAAGVGIGGLAFALAAQDTVANLFGSVNIFLDRPFQIGDWIKVDGTEGVVEEVGFRSTRVRTFYNSLVTVPNSRITNAKVDNLGVRPRRRIKLVLGLTYDTPVDKVQAFVEGVRGILAAHPLVQRTYEVHFYNLGSSSLEVLVYYHVVTPGWHEELIARSQNLLEFLRLAEDLDISFAFPSQSLYLESTPDHPLTKDASPSISELQHLVDSFAPGGSRGRPAGPGFSRSWTVQDRDAREDRGSA